MRAGPGHGKAAHSPQVAGGRGVIPHRRVRLLFVQRSIQSPGKSRENEAGPSAVKRNQSGSVRSPEKCEIVSGDRWNGALRVPPLERVSAVRSRRAGDDLSLGNTFSLRYISAAVYPAVIELIEVYKCLCDETRLRILHLLSKSALCVCHFQDILHAPQVKISKHLAYLREHGMVETRREGSWMIYSLPKHSPPELTANMKCLQDCCREIRIFKEDLRRMEETLARCAGPLADCCKPNRSSGRSEARH